MRLVYALECGCVSLDIYIYISIPMKIVVKEVINNYHYFEAKVLTIGKHCF
jgi:hypothetical protein